MLRTAIRHSRLVQNINLPQARLAISRPHSLSFATVQRDSLGFSVHPKKEINFGQKDITIPWNEGVKSAYHNIWLRDHCPCPQCKHEDTRQRLLDTSSIPLNIRAENVKPDIDGLHVTWSDGHHKSVYTWEWLRQHSYNPPLREVEPVEKILWGSEINSNPPVVEYEKVMNDDDGVKQWTDLIHKYGFAYVDGCPATPEATEGLLKRIAFIRETHYGGFWDFTSNLASKDTAYTTLALPAHTDTTYFSDPCGLQMFHLLSHTNGSGGESLLVDGFAAAKILKEERPGAYQILSTKGIPSHASGNEGISMQPSIPYPALNHHPVTKELYQVRWNNDDRKVMDQWSSPEEVEAWYSAARAWTEILRRPNVEYWEQLKPGRPMIFDNWRVLHGRGVFNGKRRLCGGYINRDDYESRHLTLNKSQKDIWMSL